MIRLLVERSAMRLCLSAAFMTCGVFAIPVFGQTVTGKWIGTQRLLDNGEIGRVFLDPPSDGHGSKRYRDNDWTYLRSERLDHGRSL